MGFTGSRAIYITEDVSPFYAKAAKMIFNDLGIDFDKAVIDYADDECISLNIDGEAKTLYFEQTAEGFTYHLVDTDDYDDLTTTYTGYDDEEEGTDPYDPSEEDFDNPYFQIAFGVILASLEIDPDSHSVEPLYYDEEGIGLLLDGRNAEIHIDLDAEEFPFVLEWIDGEEEDSGEDDPGPAADNIISFSDYSSRE